MLVRVQKGLAGQQEQQRVNTFGSLKHPQSFTAHVKFSSLIVTAQSMRLKPIGQPGPNVSVLVLPGNN